MNINEFIIDLIKNSRYSEAKNFINKLYFKDERKLYYYYLGLTCCAQGNYASALDYFKKAENSGLESSTLFYNMGVAFLEEKDLSRSEEYFKRAININNKLTDAYLNLAHIYIKTGNMGGAYRTLKTCISLTQDNNLQSIEIDLLTKLLKTS